MFSILFALLVRKMIQFTQKIYLCSVSDSLQSLFLPYHVGNNATDTVALAWVIKTRISVNNGKNRVKTFANQIILVYFTNPWSFYGSNTNHIFFFHPQWGLQDLSSWTRDWTWAKALKTLESLPIDYQQILNTTHILTITKKSLFLGRSKKICFSMYLLLNRNTKANL